MKRGNNIVLINIICLFMYSAILNTLKENGAPDSMHKFASVPILVALVFSFRYFINKFKK